MERPAVGVSGNYQNSQFCDITRGRNARQVCRWGKPALQSNGTRLCGTKAASARRSLSPASSEHLIAKQVTLRKHGAGSSASRPGPIIASGIATEVIRRTPTTRNYRPQGSGPLVARLGVQGGGRKEAPATVAAQLIAPDVASPPPPSMSCPCGRYARDSGN
jgi:hypothetical protein